MTATDFLLPDLGEGLPDAELIQWMVAVGDAVQVNQTIAEVETAKAVIELPSPHAGVVTRLHAAAGDTVEVGRPLISFDLPGAATAGAAETAEASDDAAAGETAEGDDEVVPPNLVGYGAAPTGRARPARRARSGASAVDVADDVADRAPHDALRDGERVTHEPAERPRSTPPVRKLARDLGVDLVLVTGSGRDGLIVREDVLAYADSVAEAPDVSSGTATAAITRAVGDRETRTPIRGVRKATAAAMVRSAFTAPHVTTFHTVDVTATVELVASLRQDRALTDHRIGVLTIVARAVCLAMRRHPSLNTAWDEAAGEIVQYHYVNLGIAAATKRGLIVPNIQDADALGLADLADAITELATTARAGKTSPAAMSGGTFSISNVGVFGIEAGTPIINPGEAAILAVGAVQRRPWEHRGEIALRDVMTLSLSFDHRLVDGEQGARFLVDVASILENPGRALL